MQDVIREAKLMIKDSDFSFVVRRSAVLTDTLRRMERANFSPLNKFKVNSQFSLYLKNLFFTLPLLI